MDRDNTVGIGKILDLKFILLDGHLYIVIDVADFKNDNRISLNPRD